MLGDRFTRTRFSFLIGGTKINMRTGFISAALSRFSLLVGVRLGKPFFLARGLLPLVGSNKHVIGVSDNLTHFDLPNCNACTTVGNTVRILAQCRTGRLNRHKVSIGVLTPKTVRASFNNNTIHSVSTIGRVITDGATLNHTNRPSSVNTTVTLLLSPNTR